MTISSSTQHPSEIQAVVAHVLGIARNKWSWNVCGWAAALVERDSGHTPAALAALAAWKTGRPVRVRLNRDQDMMLTGKRHPFFAAV
jgi:xanthine dehydrogenase molybdopterin-binding subunit B